jgi:ubiquinone/menaquinone biosynthesis C-methylase UbiE
MPGYLDRLKSRVARAQLKNVRFVLGSPVDPRLPRGAIDTALLIHMYHEITQPYQLLWELRRSMKADGKVAIVDLDRPSESHGMPKATLICEVKAVGFELLTITDLEPGYLAVFKPGPAVDPASVKGCRG